MRCTVLGPLTVDGSPLGSPLERRLLAALILNRGAPVSVDRLTDILWHGEPPASSLNTLQSKVSRLRRTVGPDLLQRVGNGYSLDVPDGSCDADRFDDLVSAADGLATEEKLDVLDQALSIWTGRAYEDYADEDFARPSAVRLEQRRLAAHDYRLECLIEIGRNHEVVEVTERLIDEDPFRESFWAARMQALAASGRSIEAIRSYAEARTRFIDETGLPPSAGLAALEQSIVADEPVSDGPKRESTAPAAAGDPSMAIGRPAAPEAGSVGELPMRRFDAALRRAPLVSRSSDRRLIETAKATAFAGAPQLVMVVGDVGMGKTRLIESAASAARADEVRVLSGRCVADVFVPLGPIGQIMSAIGVSRPHLDRASSPNDALNGPAAAATSSAVLRLVDYLIEEPTVLVLDDLQWADPATATAVELLVTEAETRAGTEPVPLLVLAGHRPLADDRSAHTTLQRLHRHPTTQVVELQPLDEAGVAAMVHGASSVRPSGAASARIHALTDGVPLLVETLLEHWARREELGIRAGCIDIVDGASPVAPADIDAALRQRWDRADPEMADTLTVLALCPLMDLLPLPTVANILDEVIDSQGFDALDVLDQAVELGLLDNSGRLRFPTPRVRSFIKENVPLRERAQVLQKLVTALTETPRIDGDRPVALRFPSLAVQTLEGAAESGVAVDTDDLLWWSLRSAEESLAVGAWSAAAHHLDVAAKSSPDPTAPPTLADGSPVDLAFGLASFRAHDEFRAQEILTATAARALAIEDAQTEGIALSVINRIAFAFDGASDLPVGPLAATALLEAYIHRSQDTQPQLAAQASALLAEDAAVRGELESAISHVERARSIAGGADDSSLPEISFAAGLTALSGLELNSADRYFRVSSQDALDRGDQWVASWGAGRRIFPRLLLADESGTALAIDRALDLQLPIRIWSELALTRALQGSHAAATGDLERALAFAEVAELLVTRSGYSAGRLIAAPVMAFALAGLGDADAAHAALDRLPSGSGRAPWHYSALLHLASGDLQSAQDLVETRLQRLPKQPSLNRLPAIVACAAVGAATDNDEILNATRPLTDRLEDRGVRRLPGWPALIAELTEPDQKQNPPTEQRENPW